MADTNTKTYHEQLYIDDTLRFTRDFKNAASICKGLFPGCGTADFHTDPDSYAYDIRVFSIFDGE